MLKYSNAMLKMYAGEQIKVLGYIDVNLTNQNEKRQLPLLVVSRDGQSPLG